MLYSIFLNLYIFLGSHYLIFALIMVNQIGLLIQSAFLAVTYSSLYLMIGLIAFPRVGLCLVHVVGLLLD